jgi:hypothetical protein
MPTRRAERHRRDGAAEENSDINRMAEFLCPFSETDGPA